MKNATVSVIIPTYNREKLILKAINSVLNQTYKDFEIFIIDDASTDNTEEVIRNLNNDKIKYFKLEKNSGQCVARNFGILQSKAKYVAFLDSDDEWLPMKLEWQIDCFNKAANKLGAVYGYAYQMDVIKDEKTLDKCKYYRGFIHDKFLEGYCPPTPSLFMVNRDVIMNLYGFDEQLITFVDLDMWIRISESYEFDFVGEPVIIKYEQIGDQYVNNFEKRYKGYYLFLDKWKDTVLQKKGRKGLHILKRHLAYALIVPLLEHPPQNLWKNILRLFKLLLSIRSTRFHLYFKALCILFFGTKIIYLMRKIKGSVR